MKFMVTFDWAPDAAKRSEGIARFQKTGGLPPEGAKLLGRWTRADMSGGYDLIESDDPQSIAQFSLAWGDLMDLKVYPVLDDDALTQALNRAER
jgi:hypothetical protein